MVKFLLANLEKIIFILRDGLRGGALVYFAPVKFLTKI